MALLDSTRGNDVIISERVCGLLYKDMGVVKVRLVSCEAVHKREDLLYIHVSNVEGVFGRVIDLEGGVPTVKGGDGLGHV
jgi:hypothetical protein